jgi:hypothetical protein
VEDLATGVVCGVLQLRDHSLGPPTDAQLLDRHALVLGLLEQSATDQLRYRSEYNLSCYLSREAGATRVASLDAAVGLASWQSVRDRFEDALKARGTAGKGVAADPAGRSVHLRPAFDYIDGKAEVALTRRDFDPHLEAARARSIVAYQLADAARRAKDRTKKPDPEEKEKEKEKEKEPDLRDLRVLAEAISQIPTSSSTRHVLHESVLALIEAEGTDISGDGGDDIDAFLDSISRAWHNVETALQKTARCLALLALDHLRLAFHAAPGSAYEVLRTHATRDPALVDLAALLPNELARLLGPV